VRRLQIKSSKYHLNSATSAMVMSNMFDI